MSGKIFFLEDYVWWDFSGQRFGTIIIFDLHQHSHPLFLMEYFSNMQTTLLQSAVEITL